GQPAHPGQLLDPGLDPAALVALGNRRQHRLRLRRPAHLEAVEGLLLQHRALLAGRRGDGRLVHRLELRPLADRTGDGTRSAGAAPAAAADPGFLRCSTPTPTLPP